VAPREDLREGKPLDAAEFAVHLDQVRDGCKNVLISSSQIPWRGATRRFKSGCAVTDNASVGLYSHQIHG
jgi:hypothetical protein